MPIGTSWCLRRKSRDEAEAVADTDPAFQRALGRRLDHRTVGDRVGKRDADLDHVGTGFDHCIEQQALVSRSGSPSIRNAPNAPSPRAFSRSNMRGVTAHARWSEQLLRLGDVLVAAAGKADEDDASGSASASFNAWASACADSNAQTMPSLVASARNAASASSSVAPTYSRAAALLQVRMLRADRGIIEPGRDRPGIGDLPLLVLQDIGLSAVKDAGPAAKDRRAMLVAVEALAGRLDADQPHVVVE